MRSSESSRRGASQSGRGAASGASFMSMSARRPGPRARRPPVSFAALSLSFFLSGRELRAGRRHGRRCGGGLPRGFSEQRKTDRARFYYSKQGFMARNAREATRRATAAGTRIFALCLDNPLAEILQNTRKCMQATVAGGSLSGSLARRIVVVGGGRNRWRRRPLRGSLGVLLRHLATLEAGRQLAARARG